MTRTRMSERLFSSSLILVGIVGLLTPTWYNALPANFVFEGVLLACAALVFRSPKARVAFFFCTSILYVIGSWALMELFKPSNLLDFAQAFKAFIYIAPLCMFYNREVFDRERTVKLLKIVMLLFAVKYVYSIALNFTPRMGTRPAIYVENNFELIFLMLFFYALRTDLGRSMTKWFALLSVIVVISGSRSSMLALMILFCGIYMGRFTLRTFFYGVGLGALAAVAAAMFSMRSDGGGIESVDRYKFMLVFLSEISNWPLWKYLVGNFPITALSPESCSSLSYYHGLFSFSDDGTCYSVILHSYFLRVILDHGILGLSFLFAFIATGMRGYGYQKLEILTVIGIISASALSVSAMNSVFVSLALAVILGLKHSDARIDAPKEA